MAGSAFLNDDFGVVFDASIPFAASPKETTSQSDFKTTFFRFIIKRESLQFTLLRFRIVLNSLKVMRFHCCLLFVRCLHSVAYFVERKPFDFPRQFYGNLCVTLAMQSNESDAINEMCERDDERILFGKKL